MFGIVKSAQIITVILVDFFSFSLVCTLCAHFKVSSYSFSALSLDLDDEHSSLKTRKKYGKGDMKFSAVSFTFYFISPCL